MRGSVHFPVLTHWSWGTRNFLSFQQTSRLVNADGVLTCHSGICWYVSSTFSWSNGLCWEAGCFKASMRVFLQLSWWQLAVGIMPKQIYVQQILHAHCFFPCPLISPLYDDVNVPPPLFSWGLISVAVWVGGEKKGKTERTRYNSLGICRVSSFRSEVSTVDVVYFLSCASLRLDQKVAGLGWHNIRMVVV